MTKVNRVFKVNGQPFFPIGSEDCYAGYALREGEEEFAFRSLSLMHGNSMAMPIHWDAIEPEEGKFDFTSLDSLIANARKYDIRLIPLWFATWKNGAIGYTPTWIKSNPKRFKRTRDAMGKELWSLSPHCKATLEADKKAFAAICEHLKAVDSVEQTVIALQVENEPDVVGSDRDYTPEGDAAFNSAVPALFVTAMKKQGKGQIYDLWQQAGGKESGTWSEVFGGAAEAGNFMEVWSIARYIDAVSQAGKAVYNIPTFINLWGKHGLIDSEMFMDLYRWATPHVDIIAPDNYHHDSRGYEEFCAIHTRDNNPLFMTETSGDQNMYRAIADYNCIGVHFGGIEHMVDENGIVLPENKPIADNVRCVAAVIPLLLKYQGTGKIHAIMQEYAMGGQWLRNLDGYIGVVQFGGGRSGMSPTDFRHRRNQVVAKGFGDNNARGLVIQASKHEFYLVGVGWRICLKPKLAPDKNRTSLSPGDLVFDQIQEHYLSVDEGYFDKKGKFVVTNRRNGGHVNWGLWVEADIGVVRVLLCD